MLLFVAAIQLLPAAAQEFRGIELSGHHGGIDISNGQQRVHARAASTTGAV